MTPQRRTAPEPVSAAAPIHTAAGSRDASAGQRFTRAVTTAAIPAVILSSMALAQPAQAAQPQPDTSRSPLLFSGAPTTMSVEGSSALVPATLVASQVPAALLAPARRATHRYTVKSGDTVSSIAARHGLGTSAVLKLNHLGPHTLIYPGQVIKLSGSAAAAKPAAHRNVAATGGSATSESSRYTVKPGDTISSIASRHGLGTSTVLNLNALTVRSIIYPGQTIKLSGSAGATPVPSAPARHAAASPGTGTSAPAAGRYTVKSGDTISSIASRHGMSTASVLKLNGLTPRTVIYPGQSIKLNGSTSTVSISVQSSGPVRSTASKPKASGSYTVKTGDTLGGISARHHIGLSTLLQANGLRSTSVIYPGNKLTIPGSAAVQVTPSKKHDLVPNTFLHYTYPDEVVSDANRNMSALLAAPVPSRAQMQAIITQTAQSMGVEPSLAAAFAYQESGFNHASVSPANAIGTMQVIPSSGEWASQLVGRKLNLLDPYDNVTAGIAIIRSLLRTTSSTEKAIGSYYQGQGSVDQHGLFSDTRNYVSSVKNLQKRFR